MLINFLTINFIFLWVIVDQQNSLPIYFKNCRNIGVQEASKFFLNSDPKLYLSLQKSGNGKASSGVN